jgi:hypothetical protein
VASVHEIEEALDDLRSQKSDRFNTMLNAMIRAHGVRDYHMRDDVRSGVLEFVRRQIVAGVPSDRIAPQIWSVVGNNAKSAFRKQKADSKYRDDDPDPSDPKLIAPSAEEQYEMYESYRVVKEALEAMRTSGKHADRRQYAALDAAMHGESPRERLARDFGEELSDDAAAHVVLRARTKLKSVCEIPKTEKKS